MVAAAWLLTVGLMTLMVDWLGWNKWVAQVATTGACLLFNFFLARSWVFRSGLP
jgi:putative flippase GtrA